MPNHALEGPIDEEVEHDPLHCHPHRRADRCDRGRRRTARRTAHAAGGAAPKKTTLSITKLTAGSTLSVAGKITKGTDGLANIQVAKDEAGDDFPPALPRRPPTLTGAWSQADPVKPIV